MNRPVIWIAVPFIAGLWLAAEGPSTVLAGAVVATIAGASAMVFAGPSDRLARLGCVLLFGAGGMLYWHARHLAGTGDELLRHSIARPESAVELEGIVERSDILLPELGYGRFTLRADKIREPGGSKWRTTEAGVLIRWDEPAFSVFDGDRVRVSGEPEFALSTINPEVSSYEDYLRRRGIHTTIRIYRERGIERVESGSLWSPTYLASRFRLEQTRRLMEVVPEPTLPFLLTVWLGERRLIEDSAYRAFVESGTAHILSVSGIHTAIVYASAEFLLLLVLRDYRYRRVRRVVVLSVVIVFALVSGARVSTMRAAVMIGLYVLAQLFDRDPDTPTALGISALIFTAHDPEVLFDSGFILSFLAIASLLVYQAPIVELMSRMPRAIAEGVGVSLAVQVLPLPFAAAIFYVIPVLGIVANLIVVPLLTFGLWLALLTSVLSFVYLPSAEIAGHALYPVVAVIDWTAKFVAGTSGAYVDVTRPTVFAVIVYGLGAYALYKCLCAARPRAWIPATVVLFVVSAVVWGARSAVDEVVFLDVGQGDATVVRTASGGVAVIDAGDKVGSVDFGERSVAAYLRSQGIERIDALIGTHADKDHQGGLEYVLDHFDVGTLYLTYADSGDAIEQKLIDACEVKGIPVMRIAAAAHIEVPGAGFVVLHPPAEWDSTIADNDRSVVIRAELAGKTFLLTGDIESLAESRLSGEQLASSVLKVPHHGSQTSSSPRFIAAVEPEYAVVSTGRQGRKRILSEAVLERYTTRGIEVLRTDYCGGIRFRYDGEWEIETGRGLRGYPHPVEGTVSAEN